MSPRGHDPDGGGRGKMAPGRWGVVIGDSDEALFPTRTAAVAAARKGSLPGGVID